MSPIQATTTTAIGTEKVPVVVVVQVVAAVSLLMTSVDDCDAQIY